MTKYILYLYNIIHILKLYCNPYVRTPLCRLLPEVAVVQQTRKHYTYRDICLAYIDCAHMHLERAGWYNTRII